MERLTTDKDYEIDKGAYERHLAQGYPRHIARERFLRLCEYERTGHTPEEVAEFDKLYLTKCEEVNKLNAELEELKRNNNGWIPCSKRLPQVETEVLIYARRKYTGGHFKDIITTAMYEDGTVLENDSCWRWEDIEGEWDEENDCYIIPEGWWENRHYNPDEVYNNAVDDKVIAWQPLPAPYQSKGE